ncbi:hypothetical protein K4L44_17455 [Halosquirtibacter laminarini]|uniref:Uncharacterized protein n=1 Tax=Halosquirtibacter laminarini TaxID=3374600 RepID=A0AC61NFE9_9BACT|nr:hypothetical protein K4L44_17455 [Prolixibacteraceae bacterium]
MKNLQKRTYLSVTGYVVIVLYAIFCFYNANSLKLLYLFYLTLPNAGGLGTIDIVKQWTGTKRKYDFLTLNGIYTLMLSISILFFKSRVLFLLTVVFHSVCMIGYVLYFYRKSGGTPIIEFQDNK